MNGKWIKNFEYIWLYLNVFNLKINLFNLSEKLLFFSSTTLYPIPEIEIPYTRDTNLGIGK